MVPVLRALVFAVWTALHPSLPSRPDAPLIAEGIALAVATDELPPITGMREGDAALMAGYAYWESSVSACVVGDGGRSLGTFQLQSTSFRIACNPVSAAVLWLARAHASAEHCAALPVEERLAELASGSCSRGRALVRWRAGLAMAIAHGALASQR